MKIRIQMMPYLFLLGFLWISFQMPSEFIKKDLWVIEEDSQLTIRGHSNVNSFECSIGDLGRKDTVLVTKDAYKGKIQFERSLISINTTKFDCGDNQITRDFYQTLKGDEYPFINIELIYLNIDAENVWISEKIEGMMEVWIAGHKKELIIDFLPVPSGDHSISLEGYTYLRFADFDLETPEKLFGLIKVEEKIKAEFRLKLTHLKKEDA